MKKALTLILVLVAVGSVLWVLRLDSRADRPEVCKIQFGCENLILGIQQFKEFTGSYPTGNNIQIAKALLGQSDKKGLFWPSAGRPSATRAKILDPWGTPINSFLLQ